MNTLKIMGNPLPDMPWEERPEGSNAPLWRYRSEERRVGKECED